MNQFIYYMLKKTKLFFVRLVIALVVVSGIIYGVYMKNQPGQLDEFTRCLSEKGAKFYGTFWCSHCQNQKKLFGKSAKLLPYTECSTPDGKGQLAVCAENNIEGYPTWIFADNSRLSGAIPLQTLAEKTNCQLP